MLGIEHRAGGRVASIVRGDDGATDTVRYDYDARGFRTSAEYGDRASSTLAYDTAGNLVRYQLYTDEATLLSQHYDIGDYNEVIRIRTGEGPDVSFRYDSAGRLTDALVGIRTASIAYDDLDRAVRVELDGEALATYDYAPTDADAVLASDHITSPTPVPFGASPVFGTMESVV
ncbi:MAG: hypothetical protein OXH09_05020, partial [Gammaproteobacteria bacterium]|nr:hypothetical protein [Gammaproteobacteria bacterium]